MRKSIIALTAFAMSASTFTSINAQTDILTIKENKAVNMKKFVPKGSYSGITRIEDDTYAVVSDSEGRDGFFKFNIALDPATGEVQKIENLGFYCSETVNRDAEAIAYNPNRKTLYIGGERNNSIVEFDLQGKITGQRSGNLIPDTRTNLGMESLTYDKKNKVIWTMPESTLKSDNDGNYGDATNGVTNMLRLIAFDTNFSKIREYAYKMDAPENLKQAFRYAVGVSDIEILDDGRILVLEREAFVPKLRYGAWTKCKIYLVDPSKGTQLRNGTTLSSDSPFLSKTLIWSCQTTMSFNGLNWANYEGMCLGPKLNDGSQTLILISDSQNRYQGLLQDWIKTIVISQ